MKRVVIIDDSEFFLSVSQQALEAAGYAVTALLDPGEFDPDKLGYPDLILVDINMPQFFGDDIVSFIKASWTIEAPILLHSTVSEHELKAAMARCGADGYISKLHGVEHLVLRVQELVATS